MHLKQQKWPVATRAIFDFCSNPQSQRRLSDYRLNSHMISDRMAEISRQVMRGK
jgi:hypothetical protein